MTSADPVQVGFVASLSRPGANLTGVGSLGTETNRKRLPGRVPSGRCLGGALPRLRAHENPAQAGHGEGGLVEGTTHLSPPRWPRRHASASHLSSKPLTIDPLCPIDLDSGPSPLADLSGSEYFLHWCPVGFDPSSVVAAVSMRGNADLGEFEFRTTFDLADVKNCNRVMIRPPPGRTPRLNNFLSRL